jgi:antirestriction protein
MLKAFVTNMGKYNEGCLVGEWVDLPITPAEWQAVLKRIGIDGKLYEEWFISDYDIEISGLSDYLSEYSNISLLNYLASKIADLSDYDLKLFEAALELGEHTNGICEIIELIDGMEEAYEYMPDVNTDYDLGYYWVEESGCFDTSALGNLSRYIDYEAFGRDIYLESNCCCYTSHGYIQLIDDCWCPFDVDDIPEEYRL